MFNLCSYKTSVLNLSILQFARSTWLTHFIIQYFMCLYVSSFTLIYHVCSLYFTLGLSLCLICYYLLLLFIISPASLALLPPLPPPHEIPWSTHALLAHHYHSARTWLFLCKHDCYYMQYPYLPMSVLLEY